MGAIFKQLGLTELQQQDHYPGVLSDQALSGGGSRFKVVSPIDGHVLASCHQATHEQIQQSIKQASSAADQWCLVPAPRRGELVRQLGNLFREHKPALARLITLECGKILQESLGEVQEVIDICDYAVGLSRQLHGLTIVSERPAHRMMEQWHPLGVVGVITAFNFPMAVWGWNAALALVCGNAIIWKPSLQTPLCALACQNLFNQLQLPECPDGLSAVVLGDAEAGQQISASVSVDLVSATGSVPMGKQVAATVATRLGKSLLELGGNNGLIVTPSANRELALRAVLFSAVATCGQRCTSLRRLIVHRSVLENFVQQLVQAYASICVGNPLDEGTLVGPLICEQARATMMNSLETARSQGGVLLAGGKAVSSGVPRGGFYVEPALVKITSDAPIVQQETFAPILYISEYDELDQAIEIHNAVPQGLSSAIFTDNMQEAEIFLSAIGSDCGIANVNIGTSGAEIGGAFGGEKDTGGGRESGSDAWKTYMRRATNTINYSNQLPLAQGIKFPIA
ncbi:MAG: aldehyde dehydrogenase family protein [Immundisolibacteraceae bacterium]|nr:aldehyde dehydrogenase family protein [Immundisolibacteraceae bacterium]